MILVHNERVLHALSWIPASLLEGFCDRILLQSLLRWHSVFRLLFHRHLCCDSQLHNSTPFFYQGTWLLEKGGGEAMHSTGIASLLGCYCLKWSKMAILRHLLLCHFSSEEDIKLKIGQTLSPRQSLSVEPVMSRIHSNSSDRCEEKTLIVQTDFKVFVPPMDCKFHTACTTSRNSLWVVSLELSAVVHKQANIQLACQFNPVISADRGMKSGYCMCASPHSSYSTNLEVTIQLSTLSQRLASPWFSSRLCIVCQRCAAGLCRPSFLMQQVRRQIFALSRICHTSLEMTKCPSLLLGV